MRLRHFILLTLYLRKCIVFQSAYYQRVIRVLIKISFCVLRSVYFVPPSNIQKRAIQQVIGPARALLEVVVHGSSRGSFWEQRTLRPGAPRGSERDHTTSFRVSSNL